MRLRLKDILIFFYLIVSFFLFFNFSVGLSVWLSFFVNFFFLSIIAYHHLYLEAQYSPFISAYIVFNYLFFLFAPIIQIGSFEGGEQLFATNFPYSETTVIKTNALILIFHFVFYIGYLKLKKKNAVLLIKNNELLERKHIPTAIMLIVLVVFIVLFIGYNFLIEEISRPSWHLSEFSVPQLLIYKKVLFVIPLGGVILSYFYLRRKPKNLSNYVFVIFALGFFLIALFVFKNPLAEKRNALGPIYLSLVFIFFPKLINTNVKSLFILFFSMIVLFPLIQIITHVEFTFEEIVQTPEIITDEFAFEKLANTYNTINYDAFSNIGTIIEYVSIHGYSYGYQLLSAALFFVPRFFWPDKPGPSGKIVGDYLIDEYGFTYNNLSNPIVSEGYLNFGVFGVIIAAIVLAFFIVFFLKWLNRGNELKKVMAFYFAMHLLFLLRGDLTNGFSYYVGTLIGVVFIPWLIIKLLSTSVKFKK